MKNPHHQLFSIIAICATLGASSIAFAQDNTAMPAQTHSTDSPSIASDAMTKNQVSEPAYSPLQTRWAQIKYELPENQRVAAFEALTTQADTAVKSNPQDAGVLIWRGIVLASWAGAKGGLGALSLVKRARKDFENALRIDPTALNGSAHTSLGSLYYQVPGWPVGFGDDDKAREHLQAGLKLNPDGIDSNYFWADFLHEEGDDQQAKKAAEKALQAPDRPGRSLADKGRRDEIRALLAKIDG